MVEIYVPRRDGMYRHSCECGGRSESQSPFDPDRAVLEPGMTTFMNVHTGLGHRGVTEFWVQGHWVEGGRFAPMTDGDWDTIEAMGGLT